MQLRCPARISKQYSLLSQEKKALVKPGLNTVKLLIRLFVNLFHQYHFALLAVFAIAETIEEYSAANTLTRIIQAIPHQAVIAFFHASGEEAFNQLSFQL
jgi:2-methylaconitate cis-trans-isomerase PrpF